MKNLKTLLFSIQIKSTKEHIWDVLWNPKTYEEWTRVFMEGSHYKGELKQGNTIQFLGKYDGGMSSIIEKMIENEQMVFSHQKEVKNGVEIDSSWQGAKEIYYLKKENDTTTELQVIMDITQDMEDYFNKTFPKALVIVKQISEQ
ncbi:SRPBCC domain-containing protein [Zobellia galactanivorans]|uniref:SRPBCC domain-containing protein n=1 Tax=Zobellia galactanivorans (strain DSM 12802 / CCUG 47099 / CIP 106680 / NCIMB 13871 / Dsij) TaxID=63186 RepID=UPI001C0714D4|nr:SRPBCC domain-containing protein [Zobellia galactanivorans]MBU3026380.1 SRPBCC domain-containing protein [Zobellia galactanivorans]